MEDLGTLPGGEFSYGLAINDLGQIVGESTNVSGVGVAVMWTNNKIWNLGILGGGGPSANSVALGINKSGQVVGRSTFTSSRSFHAFLWTLSQGMQDLGTLQPGDSSVANAINDAGEVTGTSTPDNAVSRAFFWSSSTGMEDIGTLGGGYAAATSINDSGQVTGGSTLP
jgi:probable HAF family extracellular repeat protein